MMHPLYPPVCINAAYISLNLVCVVMEEVLPSFLPSDYVWDSMLSQLVPKPGISREKPSHLQTGGSSCRWGARGCGGAREGAAGDWRTSGTERWRRGPAASACSYGRFAGGLVPANFFGILSRQAAPPKIEEIISLDPCRVWVKWILRRPSSWKAALWLWPSFLLVRSPSLQTFWAVDGGGSPVNPNIFFCFLKGEMANHPPWPADLTLEFQDGSSHWSLLRPAATATSLKPSW